jgi:DNA-binding MarR family transcriptional regulator|uniref:HTH-type transcriptional regulator SarZ n=1 Tax=Mesoaciditoga lauensis TaxID=1495039 RepID=A0A7V3RDK9_9BACT
MNELPEDLLMVCSIFSNTIFKGFDYSKIKLPKTSAGILFFMKKHSKNVMKMSELENHSNFVKSTLTVATDTLVYEGYVKRYRSEEDRRVVFIELTEKGNEKANEILGCMKKYVNEKLGMLDNEQFTKLLDALEKIRDVTNVLKGEETR